MQLEGSCHCGAVRFRLRSRHPYPFNLCYCSICRKTAGGGGFAINLGGEHGTLEVTGREHLRVYRAKVRDGDQAEPCESPAERHFCARCGSHLWLWDPRWPKLVHPLASAIDTPLPTPPERTHLMLGSKASWVEPGIGPSDQQFAEYPEESIAAWHERLGLTTEPWGALESADEIPEHGRARRIQRGARGFVHNAGGAMRVRPMLWLILFLVLFVLPHVWTAGLVYGGSVQHWSQARWDSSGLAPDPLATPEPVVQVYAARAWGWKGVFAVHSWIVTKRANAPMFERYEVVGWGVRRGAPAVRRNMREIDGRWAGNEPELLLDRRGPEVEALIDQIEAAIMSYPYPGKYRTWPGPNSNTFIAHIGRAVPALGLELPPTAIGKDYLNNGSLFARTPSGTGYQVSLLGLVGLSMARDEGLEINLLGLTFGLDPLDFALKLPGIGRLGRPEPIHIGFASPGPRSGT